jgi:hypothetical protein
VRVGIEKLLLILEFLIQECKRYTVPVRKDSPPRAQKINI